ncbi:MAG: hypothetical protein H7226_08145 [Salinibacterium sp.]|nr:hypothetical protein [Salinibacterium sp.]
MQDRHRVRTVTSRLELDIQDGINRVISSAAAHGSAVTSEPLSFVLDGEPQRAKEVADRRWHRARARG